MPLATITRLEPFNINNSATFSFASTSVTANVSAGNVLTDNLLYANGVAWAFSSYSNTNVAAYLPTYTGNYSGNNVTLTGNISTGSGSGNISGANYVIANYFQGDGSLLTGLPSAYSNANVAAYLPTFTGNFTAGNISTTGNITAAYFIGNGSQLTGLPASYSNTNVAAYLPTYTGNLSANVITANNATINGSITTGSGTGNISGANFVNANYFTGNGSLLSSITGSNVTGQVGNALVAGTVYTAAQPNITSVGTLASLDVTANVSAGNILTNNLLYANGVAWNFGGGGGSYSNANVAAYLPTYTGTLGGALSTNAQPNITSVGTLSSLSVSGLTTATGGIKVGNIQDTAGTNTISVSSTTVGVIGNLTVGTGGAGNATATNFVGNGYYLTGINGSNVLGQVGNALVSGTVYSNAQPNITSVGTLASLSVTANASAGNILTDNLLYANGVAWSFSGGSGATITDDTSTNATYYPVYATSNTGSFTTAGITTTKLQFNPSTGQLTVQDLNTLSDATLKEDSYVIEDPFIVLNQLFGMGFTWSESKRKSYGLLAQMLEGVLPELVNVNAQGKKTVNYIPIIAFLIEAVKKQQQDIEALKKDKY